MSSLEIGLRVEDRAGERGTALSVPGSVRASVEIANDGEGGGQPGLES